MKQRVLVIGIGNPLRQDDGTGPYCVSLLETKTKNKNKELVDYLTVHQLDVLHSSIFAGYSVIIFIDADSAVYPGGLRVEEILPESKERPFTTHIGAIPDILAVTQTLYGATPKAFLIAVAGSSFEIGEGLSEAAAGNSQKAVDVALQLIGEFFPLV